MAHFLVEHCCSSRCTPTMLPTVVYQITSRYTRTSKSTCNTTYSRGSYLNIRSTLVIPRLFRWTLPYTRRANPLDFKFFLDVKIKSIHRSVSAHGARLCHWHTVVLRRTLKPCPAGDAGRTMFNSIVERLRLSTERARHALFVLGDAQSFSSLGRFNPCKVRSIFARAKCLLEFLICCRNSKTKSVILRWGAIIPLCHWGGSFVQNNSALERAAHR